MTKSTGKRPGRPSWTDEQWALFHAEYRTVPNLSDLARRMGISRASVEHRAWQLGIKRDPAAVSAARRAASRQATLASQMQQAERDAIDGQPKVTRRPAFYGDPAALHALQRMPALDRAWRSAA